MEVTRIRALRGPNLWSRRTVIEVGQHVIEDISRDHARIASAAQLPARIGALAY